MAAAGFPVPAHRPIRHLTDLLRFGEAHGWPVVAKAARGGYDGRGVWVVDGAGGGARPAGEHRPAWNLLVEAWVPIEREIAVLVARRPAGETVVYPVVETVQRDGICHELLAPAPVSPAIAERAGELAPAVAEAIGVVGVMALELFVTGDQVLINEIAARPHNSGHYSIEGCVTSQFEQHLRAVLDWPLGATELTAPAVATVNVLGGPDGERPTDATAGGAGDARRPRPSLRQGRAARSQARARHRAGPDIAEARQRAARAAAALTGATCREDGAMSEQADAAGRRGHGQRLGPAGDAGGGRGAGRVRRPLRGAHPLGPPHARRDARLRPRGRRPRSAGDHRRRRRGGAPAGDARGGDAAAGDRRPGAVATPLAGIDALLSIAQMPAGVPVATVAIGGARNAGLLAVRILATADPALRAAMERFQAELADKVRAKDAAVRAQFA